MIKVLIFLFLFLVFSGCSKNDESISCVNSLDCREGYECVDGKCVEKVFSGDNDVVPDESVVDNENNDENTDIDTSDNNLSDDLSDEADAESEVSDEDFDEDFTDVEENDIDYNDEDMDDNPEIDEEAEVDEDMEVDDDSEIPDEGETEPDPLPYPEKSSYFIKGIQPDYWSVDDIVGNMAGRVSMNIVWAHWEPVEKSPPCDETSEVEFKERCYVIDFTVHNAIKAYSDKDVIVTGVLYGVPAWARTGNTNCSPADTGFDIFCSADDPSLYGKFTGMIAKRYNGLNGNGRVVDFVIHNEVNSNVWFDIGCGSGIPCNQENWIQEYADNFNAAYDEIIEQQPYAKVLTSFEHHFGTEFDDMNSTYPTVSVQTFLTSFAPKVAPREWRVAYHSYPPDLTKPQFSIFDWPRVTFGNIGVIAGWLIKTFPSVPSAHEIQLTENGISSHPNDVTGYDEQAAWLCKSFQTVLGTPGITSYIYHRMKDHPYEVASGAALGLVNADNTYKPAWAVWALANRFDTTPQQLSCGFEDLPYTRLTRYNNGVKHWATTRIPPDGYNTVETSWKLYRYHQSGTKMVYECLSGSEDNFISSSPDCEGQANYGPLGYVYTSQVAGTFPIYRCFVTGSHHFVSADPGCEGQASEGLIGFVYH